MSGTLFVVGTPIGNLGDITLRAIETLKSVEFVIAEDTRVTGKLLAHLGIKKPLVSLRERSSKKESERVAARIAEGESAAYVTDAGTPGVSDPGGVLVETVRTSVGEQAIKVIPGASALASAVSVAGVPLNEFVFHGFLPHKKGRQKKLDEILADERAHVLYESPHRVKKLLDELFVRAPERNIILARELTKVYEQTAYGSVAEILSRIGKEIPIKGEFVVIVAAA